MSLSEKFKSIIDSCRKTLIIKTLTINKRKEIDESTDLSSTSKKIMTIEELILYLDEKTIPKKYYAIGVEKDDSICILKENKWLVFYSERGERSLFFTSSLEKKACQEFLLILKKTIATDTNRIQVNLQNKL